jgi:hypothetical protein
MKKADRTEFELMLQTAINKSIEKSIEPLVKTVDRHEITIEDATTGLKGRVQRHGERINNLERFQTEIKAKMAVVSAAAATVTSVTILFVKSLFK